jgi:hypothetical protein
MSLGSSQWGGMTISLMQQSTVTTSALRRGQCPSLSKHSLLDTDVEHLHTNLL